MEIHYTYCTAVIIVLDDMFEIHTSDNLDNIVKKIERAFNEYGFSKADVIDEETGEVLIQVNEKN